MRSTVVALEFCFWNYVIESVWVNIEAAGLGCVLLGTASAPANQLQLQQLVGEVEMIERHVPLAAVPNMQT